MSPSLSPLEHAVLLRSFGLHDTARLSDEAVAQQCSIDLARVAAVREAAVAKVLESARSNKDRFRVVAELLSSRPELLAELFQRLVPATPPPKPPRPKREQESAPPVPEHERRYGRAVWDEALQAKVVRVDRALLGRGGTHEFDLECPGVLRFYVCCGEVWPSPYPFGIYWYPDDRHTAAINWESPQKPLRTTVGGEPLIVAFDDASGAELASAQPVEPFEWKDD